MPTLQECRDDPSLIDQVSGCCGFAAALMALVERNSQVVDDLVACVFEGHQFGNVARSTRIKDRVRRRERVGILDTTTQEDWALCFGLMILLKEHAKQNNLNAWNKCIQYSLLFQWGYSNIVVRGTNKSETKLKPLTGYFVDWQVDQDFDFVGLSYKKGDLALPFDVLPTLLGLLGLQVHSTDDLGAGRVNFAVAQPPFVAQLACREFSAEMRGMQTAQNAQQRQYDGVILGVGKRPDAQYGAYRHVCHWVYVPVSPTHGAPGAGDFKIWTWGQEREFWSDFVVNAGYYPAYALRLAR
jgi:hypothetical protein